VNKTIYLRDDEGPIWDRARELSNDKLSLVVVAGLKRFVAEKEAQMRGFERIEFHYNDSSRGGRPTAKAFYGRWLLAPNEEFKPPISASGRKYGVAISSRGSVVLFEWTPTTYARALGKEELKNGKFSVYPSFEAALEDKGQNDIFHWEPREAVHEAMQRLGVPVEELDI
jgi:hypothetical protein